MSSFSIGVDLGGTNLRVGAFTSDHRRVGHSAIPTRVSAGPVAVARDIADEIQKLLKVCLKEGQLQGIGVGTPGPLELPSGKLGLLPNFPGFEGFELKKTLEEMLQLPVCIEKDANAAALGEFLCGAGKDRKEDSLCMLTLGTGVGGGVILNGQLWHGMNGMAGETGHIPIHPHGPVCPCGGRGCLEVYASATGIRRMATEIANAGNSPAFERILEKDAAHTTLELARLADGGDAQAIALYAEVGRTLGIGLASLVNVLNLPLYVLGGGVANAWHLFSATMMQTLTEYSYVYRLTDPDDPKSMFECKTHIMPATLGAEAGLLGAAMLPYSLTEPTPKLV